MVPTVRGACPQSPAVPDPLHLSSTNCEAVSHAEAPPRPGGRDLGLPKRPLDSCGVRKLSASSFQLSAVSFQLSAKSCCPRHDPHATGQLKQAPPWTDCTVWACHIGRA